jgi:adenosylcobinamide kinase/adenosylcobinamide-phosphate guanylyltransferase
VAARLTPILEREVAGIIEAARTSNATLLVVSNEVGLGLVPDNPLGRIYRDLLGFVNRWLAAAADQVLLMVAGLPLDVKQLALGELP